MILATTTISTFVKYVLYVIDLLMEGQWEKKAVYTFYLELIRDLLHLTMYMCFFLVIFVNYGVPLHLIRELYETFRNFKIRVADYILYRKITSNMNDRFPDATSEELDANDATCIICREEMSTAKMLICGHLFHVHCLRTWLERQNTCPTCRARVIPPENEASTAGSRADGHHHGTGVPSHSRTPHGSAGNGLGNDNVSQLQLRLQAAAAASSVYQKSFVYPSPHTLMWSPGYVALTQILEHSDGTAKANETVGASTSGVSQQCHYPNTTFMQLPHSSFVSSQFPGFIGIDTSESQLDLQRKLIENQIEFLQHQLRHLSSPNSEETTDQGSSDVKGKNIQSASSSVLSSSENGKSGCTP